MKTLVYILPDKDAGVASVVRNLLRFKTNRFATKVVLIHNHLDDDKRRVKDNFNADKIIRLTYHGKWSSKYSIYKKIVKELDKNTVLISNDGFVELDALNYCKNSIRGVAYIFHGDFKHYFKVLNEKHDHINTVITVSEFLKDKLVKILATNSAIKLDNIKFPVPSANSFNKITANTIRLVFVGSLSDRKGVMSFIPITKELDMQNIEYKLTIIGDGEKEIELKAAFKENNKVCFLGKLNNIEVLDLYKKQDVILLPSKGEGLPVVIVEAMKYGVVPIATKLESGIPELIEHSVNGFTVPLQDVKQYVTFIKQLYTDRSLLKNMSILCREKAEQLFNPEQQTKQYENAFNNTIVSSDYKVKKNLLDYLPMTIAHRLQTYLKK